MKQHSALHAALVAVTALALTFSGLFTGPPSANAATATENEPNNSTATATKIATNTAMTGAITNGNDNDYYVFTLSARGYVSLNFVHANVAGQGGKGWSASLQNGSSSTYFTSISSDPGQTSVTSPSVGLAAGTYYVHVAPQSAYSPTTSQYALTVKYTQTNSWETEFNQSTSQANLINVNEAANGTIPYGNDNDYYVFTIPIKQFILLTLTHANATSNGGSGWRAEILSSSSTRLASVNSGLGQTSVSASVISLAAGTYYVHVAPQDGYSPTTMTPYAVTVRTVVPVTFNVNGGKKLTSSKASKMLVPGSAVGTLPTSTRTGYAFAGWYTAKSGGTKASSSTKISQAKTFYAHWAAKTYTVKFNTNGGKKLASAKASKKVVYASHYGSLPTPSRSGHKFNGWYTAKSGGKHIISSSKVSITKTTTMYAHWKK